VIHRDVKPDNLFLLGEPGAPTGAKVLDFGLAKVDDGNLSLTAHGVAVGTMDYMAPEQALTDPVDARADVYALGMVMYKAFLGRPPWRPVDDYDMIAHHLLVPVPAPSSVKPGIDRQLDKVIQRALRKNPDNRYATMKEMVDDLDRVIGSRRGPLVAAREPPEEDTYVPTSRGAKLASLFFYDRLGKPMPPWSDIRSPSSLSITVRSYIQRALGHTLLG
jgi:serine/threonine-protein kinase